MTAVKTLMTAVAGIALAALLALPTEAWSRDRNPYSYENHYFDPGSVLEFQYRYPSSAYPHQAYPDLAYPHRAYPDNGYEESQKGRCEKICELYDGGLCVVWSWGHCN